MVTMTESGRCAFRVYLPHAGDVQLLGSFAAWEEAPIPMSRDGAGWWCTETPVTSGEHEFCYLVDGELWMPDYAASGIRRNHAGNWISLLFVPDVAALSETDRPAGADSEPRTRRLQVEAPLRFRGRDAGARSASGPDAARAQ